MKKIIMVHGWGGNSSYFDDLKKELEEKAEVIALDMPDTDNPRIESWVNYLDKKVRINEETYFIGHSIGCQAIMRYLENLPKNAMVNGVFFIAGWVNLKGLDSYEKLIAKPWLETPVDFNKVKEHCKKIMAIFSDDDPYVSLDNVNLFKDKLGAKTKLLNNKEHIENIKDVINDIKEFIR